jgi:hypothetical protein
MERNKNIFKFNLVPELLTRLTDDKPAQRPAIAQKFGCGYAALGTMQARPNAAQFDT